MNRPVLVFLLLAIVSGLHAQEGETVSTTAVSLSSLRVFRGVERSGAGGQGTFQVIRSGWRAGAEIDQPFDRDEPGEGNLHAAFAWNPTQQVKLEAVVTQRWFSEVAPGATRHSFEAGLSAAWTLSSGLAVELAGFHDFRLKADTLQVSVSYSMPLKNLGAYLEWSASIGTSTARDLLPDGVGPPVRDSYSYYTASVRLPYRIGAHTTLVSGLHIAESDNQNRVWSSIGARGGARVWVDAGLSFDF